jgi:hypothetical protein
MGFSSVYKSLETCCDSPTIDGKARLQETCPVLDSEARNLANDETTDKNGVGSCAGFVPCVRTEACMSVEHPDKFADWDGQIAYCDVEGGSPIVNVDRCFEREGVD